MILLFSARPCHTTDFDYDVAKRSVVTVYCETAKSAGGGVVISKTTIVSLLHITDPCRQVVIGHSDGTFALGTVTDTDEERDLVLIRPEQPALTTPATLSMDTPEMGDSLHLISHLNGMPWTYTPGVLAYPDERIISVDQHKFSLLVVNVSSYNGSSGGALFNSNGHVIGFAKGMLAGTSIAYFVPSRAVCHKLTKCRTDNVQPQQPSRH